MRPSMADTQEKATLLEVLETVPCDLAELE